VITQLKFRKKINKNLKNYDYQKVINLKLFMPRNHSLTAE